MRLDVSADEFWAENGPTDFIDRLAAVLNIPTYRIRVADTYRGSTYIRAEIVQELSLVDLKESNGEKSTVVELKNLQKSLVESAENEELGMGYPVLSLNSKVLDATAVTDGASDDNEISIILIPGDGSADSELSEEMNGGLVEPESDGNSDSDDKWYDPLTLDQVVYIMIAAGIAIIVTVVGAVIFIRKHKKNNRIAQPSLDLDSEPIANKTGHIDAATIPENVGKIEIIAAEQDDDKSRTARSMWTPEDGHIAPIASESHSPV